MASGRIIKLVPDRGFGFIGPDGGGDDRFFHSSALMDACFDELSVGLQVQYEEKLHPEKGGQMRWRATTVLLA